MKCDEPAYLNGDVARTHIFFVNFSRLIFTCPILIVDFIIDCLTESDDHLPSLAFFATPLPCPNSNYPRIPLESHYPENANFMEVEDRFSLRFLVCPQTYRSGSLGI